MELEKSLQKTNEDIKSLNEKVTLLSKDHYLIPRSRLWHLSGGFIATLLAAGILGWGAYKSFIHDKSLETKRERAGVIVGEMESLKQQAKDNMVYSQMPIGTIIGWHKDAEKRKGTSSKDSLILPKGWQVCNGEPILNDKSPFYGKDTPNLNKEGVFLRGGNESGKELPQSIPGLTMTSKDIVGGNYSHNVNIVYGEDNSTKGFYGGSFGVGGHPNNVLYFEYTNHEIRPKNISVVWIMKIR